MRTLFDTNQKRTALAKQLILFDSILHVRSGKSCILERSFVALNDTEHNSILFDHKTEARGNKTWLFSQAQLDEFVVSISDEHVLLVSNGCY